MVLKLTKGTYIEKNINKNVLKCNKGKLAYINVLLEVFSVIKLPKILSFKWIDKIKKSENFWYLMVHQNVYIQMMGR